MRDFLRAPESVQAAFMEQIRREAEAERDFNRYISELLDNDPVPPALPRRKLPRHPTRWDSVWSKRARVVRAGGKRSDVRDFDAEREALTAIPTAAYVSALLGESLGEGKVNCPLPDHDERTGSMHVYPGDRGWYCFGCHRGGAVYELAAAMWGLQTRGAQFRELHNRLCNLFGVAA